MSEPTVISSEYVHAQIQAIHPNKYVIVTPYTSYYKPFQVKCTRCNSIIETNYVKSCIRKSLSCKHCVISDRIKTVEGYEAVSKCVTLHTDTVIRHSCGHEYTIKPNNFLNQNGSRCPSCEEKKRNPDRTDFGVTEFAKFCKKFKLHVIKSIHSYTNIHEPSLVTLRCGCRMELTPKELMVNKIICDCGIPYNSGNPKGKSPDEFVESVRLINNTFQVLSQYYGNKEKITILHTGCGKTFDQRPNDLLRNFSCPHCSKHVSGRMSAGEKIIFDFLTRNNISFEYNSTIPGFKHKRPLRFDFVIFDSDSRITKIIEFDGKQHFEPMFSNKEFVLTQERDKIKNTLCLENNIELIRLNYRDHDGGLLESKLSSVFND